MTGKMIDGSRISVIVPLYNKGAVVGRTLDSIASQTACPGEVIVVDDGSTDGSADVVIEWCRANPHFKVRLVRQSNSGVAAARNRGISEAQGEFVAFLDADDVWKPEWIETHLTLAALYPTAGLFATNYEYLLTGDKIKKPVIKGLDLRDPSNNAERKEPSGEEGHGIINNYFAAASVSAPPVWTSAVMARKSVMEEVGLFPLDITSGEDLLTWARIAVRHPMAYDTRPMAVYVQDKGFEFSERPRRIPQPHDPVGKELVRLLQEIPTPGLRKYISFWHKMRGVIYYRAGMHCQSMAECMKALRYNPLNYKAAAIAVLNLIKRNR